MTNTERRLFGLLIVVREITSEGAKVCHIWIQPRTKLHDVIEVEKVFRKKQPTVGDLANIMFCYINSYNDCRCPEKPMSAHTIGAKFTSMVYPIYLSDPHWSLAWKIWGILDDLHLNHLSSALVDSLKAFLALVDEGREKLDFLGFISALTAEITTIMLKVPPLIPIGRLEFDMMPKAE